MVLGLIEDLPAEVDGTQNTRYRALLVLMRTDGGTLRRVAATARLLPCATCAGMFDGEPDISIERGVIIISTQTGSRELSTDTMRFRYDPPVSRFLLIGRDIATADRLTATVTSESNNYLTGVRIITREGRRPTRQQIPRTRKFLEDIDNISE